MPGAGADEVFSVLDGNVLGAAVLTAKYEPEDLDDLFGDDAAAAADDLDWDAEA